MGSVAHGSVVPSESPAGAMERAEKTRSGCHARGSAVRSRSVSDGSHVPKSDDLFEFGCEMIIDLEISAEISPLKLGEVQPIMQDWPQHLIGKAAIIFVKAFLRKVSNYVF